MSDLELSTIKQSIRNYILEISSLPTTDTEIDDSCNLLEQQIIDSYGFLELLTFLEAEWDITFSDTEQTEDELGAIDELARAVHQKVLAHFDAVDTPRQPLTDRYIAEHLQKLGVKSGMKVVVHSSLLSFGHVQRQTSVFIEELVKAVGASGTIAVPTFTLQLTSNDLFDPASTPSRTSALSEAFRVLPGTIRSPSPLHSYTALGKDSDIVSTAAANRSFGEGSCLDRFVTDNFHWLFLGCGSRGEGCTLSHHTEATFGVPYRKWISFPRKILSPSNKIVDIEYHYYARRDGFSAKLNVMPVQEELLFNRKMTKIKAPIGFSYFSKAMDIHGTGLKLLEKDPYSLTQPARGNTAVF